MLTEIGSVQNISVYFKRVKAGEGRLMGFGHRAWASYDPAPDHQADCWTKSSTSPAEESCSISRSNSSASRFRTK